MSETSEGENQRIKAHERYRNFGKVYLTTIIAVSLIMFSWFQKYSGEEICDNKLLKQDFQNWVLTPFALALFGSFTVLGIYFFCYLIEAREFNWDKEKKGKLERFKNKLFSISDGIAIFCILSSIFGLIGFFNFIFTKL